MKAIKIIVLILITVIVFPLIGEDEEIGERLDKIFNWCYS